MSRTLCEQVAAPLLKMHRQTTPPAATVGLAILGVGVFVAGLAIGNHHALWGGVLLAVIGWYGFLLSGCERLLAAQERELAALRENQQR